MSLTDKEIADRVRACRPCTAIHRDAHHFVHVSDCYDDGCYEYATTLLEYLLEGDQ